MRKGIGEGEMSTKLEKLGLILFIVGIGGWYASLEPHWAWWIMWIIGGVLYISFDAKELDE
jgi:hypothetical protein